MRGEAEAEAFQLINARGDERDEAAAFRIEQEAEGAGEREAQGLGDAAREGVIEDDGGTVGFEREGEDARFTGAEVAGERERGCAGRVANGDPREDGRIGQIEARLPALGEFLHDRVWNHDATGERGQDVQPAELVEILER